MHIHMCVRVYICMSLPQAVLLRHYHVDNNTKHFISICYRPPLSVSDSVHERWSLRIGVFTRVLGDIDIPALDHTYPESPGSGAVDTIVKQYRI